jgi:hypothetical protein
MSQIKKLKMGKCYIRMNIFALEGMCGKIRECREGAYMEPCVIEKEILNKISSCRVWDKVRSSKYLSVYTIL